MAEVVKIAEASYCHEMADHPAEDLAADEAAHAGLMAALRTRNRAPGASCLSLRAPINFVKNITIMAALNAHGPSGMTALLVACLQGSVADVELLLAFGADPKSEGDVWDMFAREKEKAFPLYAAAREGEGHAAIVEVLLACDGVDINQGATDSGKTALYVACEWGSPHIVGMLLALDGIDVNKVRIADGATPLHSMCYEGNAEIAKLLLAHDAIDVDRATTDDGTTPLYTACMNGYAEIVKLLLAHDEVDVNKVRSDIGTSLLHGAFPLYIACIQKHAGIVKLLLTHGMIDVNKAIADGDFPLYTACFEGNAAIVKLLLAHHNIDANKAMPDDGATPLYTACNKGDAVLVKLLLAHSGIDVNTELTDTGETPLYAACIEGHPEVVRLLIAHVKVDANKALVDSEFPLYSMCYEGNAEIVKLLLTHSDIDVNKENADTGATPLYTACINGHAGIVKLLLAHDEIDANKGQHDGGLSPLHAAIIVGAHVAMQYLVVYGASILVEDTDGDTPAQYASATNKPELAEWLNAVSGWSQLRIAAGCRLYKDAAFLLRRGKIDPDDLATTTLKDMMAVVATSNAKPAWQNAPPICKTTQKLVADAMRGWHRTTHWLHHKAVRDAVFAVLVAVGRLQQKAALPTEAACNVRADVHTAALSMTAQVPLLPIEIWFFAMRFFKRSWWEVDEMTAVTADRIVPPET